MSKLETTQSYLFMTLGAPGSGKSFTSDWLTPKFSAIRIKSDELRCAMFGKPAPLETHDEPYSSWLNGAMEYAAKQALSQSHSVVYDTNMNSIQKRERLGQLARQLGALPVIVWIQTPIERAKERATARDRAELGHEPNIFYVDMMAAKLEPPTGQELVVVIDGLQTADQQQKSFDEQFERIVLPT
jgi:predicted kinase